MSGWFDRLLEDLQRRQVEQDARREGRPLPPRRPPPRRPPPDDDGGPTPFPRRRHGGGTVTTGDVRRWVIIGLIVLVALFLLGFIGRIVDLITDVMWYDALGRRDVLTTRLWSQVGLFFVGLAAFAIPALASIWLARRIAPQVPIRRLGFLELPDASRFISWGLVVIALLLALISAGAWSGSWETILLFANGGDFGTTDANFTRDIGFYVFDLPFWRFLQGWAIASLIGIGLLTLGAYAAGALRWQLRLTAPVRAHLSIIGALLLAVIAIGYQLDIPELVYSTRSGTFQGATYADLNAQVPAYVILTVVALAAAALLLANIWFRTLWALALAGGAWLALSIVVGGIYPSVVQTLTVKPNELTVERPFIAKHIAATRAAFELDTIEERNYSGEAPLTRRLIDTESGTLNNLRLWDYRPLLSTFGQDQILRVYYDFADVDIDRYEVSGERRQIMLSARELDVDKLDANAKTWTNERLVYTHGYGITAVPVNAVTSSGLPDYLVSGINREPRLPVGQPRIYFGELEDNYVVTGTTTAEFDYPREESAGDATTTWDGSTGVGIGNPIARFLFALRFGDFNLLISNQLTEHSQILFRRTLTERVQELAPFLAYDGDPYMVSADGRLIWMWDAYTYSSRYPNAQPLPEGSPLAGVNYLRNSVKVAVDAYDGSVHFYVADPSDPIIAAYGRIFPGLFEPIDAMSDGLRAHVRYPENLFQAQTEMYLLYHVQPDERGAGIFYNRDDVWELPEEQLQQEGSAVPVEPYYVIMRIPGEQEVEFVLIQPLVAAQRPNMIAWVAARNDGEHYGERISFRFPTDTSTDGPVQVEARIDQDDTISGQFSLWDRAGSRVIRGNLIVLPMGDSILYMEPIFLQATQARFPEFVRVIFVSQDRVAFAESVDEGLRQLLGEATTPPPGGGGGGGGLPEDVAGLVAEAQRLYAAAQEALAAGDLGTYQARIDDLQEVLDRLAQLTGASPLPSPSASPSASP
jgi:uncharacterized membrane protein (UPF0182 family)